MFRPTLPLSPLLILIAVFAACSGAEETGRKSAGERSVYKVRGIFARAEVDGTTMTVRHEEIPGYMASMTMPFTLREAAMLEGLEYGDKIEFELSVDDNGALVNAITKLPAETVLAFE